MTDRLHTLASEGIGTFDEWGVIVVPNTMPPDRVREFDFPSIFTRTRARTRRAAAHGSFPTCESPTKRHRSA